MKILRSLMAPVLGILFLLLLWTLLSMIPGTSLPGPVKTWEASKLYLLQPLAKRGENDQGILRFAAYSLVLVAKGYAISMAMAIPLGFAIGIFPFFNKLVDPIIQLFRPVSPLAWLPLGLVVFQNSLPAAIFTIAICAMWPTVVNIALGVRSVPQEYLNVARVLKLPAWKTFVTVLFPATVPNMFTGMRISFGIAWLAIVAAEMLTGSPGLGGFLWQEYNSLVYEHIILCIFSIGLIGLALDRMMGLLELSFSRR